MPAIGVRSSFHSRKELQSLSDLSMATAMNFRAAQTPLTPSCSYVKHYSLQTNRLEGLRYWERSHRRSCHRVFYE